MAYKAGRLGGGGIVGAVVQKHAFAMGQPKACPSEVEDGGVRFGQFLIARNDNVAEPVKHMRFLGAEGRPGIAALALDSLAAAPAFRRVALRELGPDIWESYERVS